MSLVAGAAVAAPPPRSTDAAVVARVKGIAERAALIEAVSGMGEVDRAMRMAMLNATRTFRQDSVRRRKRKRAGSLRLRTGFTRAA